MVNILSIATSLLGIASFVMFVLGAIIYQTSGGNPKGTELGSKTMSYAIWGVALGVSGWIVINFVSVFTGVEGVKTFQIVLPN